MQYEFAVHIEKGGGKDQFFESVKQAVDAGQLQYRPGVYEVTITRARTGSDNWQRVSEQGITAHVWRTFVIRRSDVGDGWLLFHSNRVVATATTVVELKDVAAVAFIDEGSGTP